VPQKEIATKQELINVLDLSERSKIRYWPDCGWGVDILVVGNRPEDISYGI